MSFAMADVKSKTNPITNVISSRMTPLLVPEGIVALKQYAAVFHKHKLYLDWALCAFVSTFYLN